VSRCFALRHVPFESLGILSDALATRGFETNVIDVPLTALPHDTLADAELLIVLGGPIGAYEEQLYPFIADELAILERRLKANKPTLGICLGAQLLARALGARVYPGQAKEIGWAPLQLTSEGAAGPLGAVGNHAVLHWHGDTFDLPSGATRLASTPVTPNQAFAWQRTAVALQFHLEVTALDLEAWLVGHTCELAHWGQSTIPELRRANREFAPRLRLAAEQAFGAILDPWK
jgi:GMP synthase (glutamine-hydrolysing)